MKAEIIRIERVSKSLEGDDALHNLNLTLYKGEILSVLGLNGSGKSRLTKLLAGEHTADQGRVFVDNVPTKIQSPSIARKLGIYFIRQNSQLVPSFTIAENIFVIRQNPWRNLIINDREIFRKTRALLKTVGLDCPPDTLIGVLSSLQIHIVEIAKAIQEGVRVVIMDDVVDEYSPSDFEVIKKLLHTLCRQGIGVLVTSRKWEVAMGLSDRITVLRDGTTVRTLYRDEFSKQTLVKLLTGGNFDESHFKTAPTCTEEVLKLDNLTTEELLSDVNLVLHRGEVLSLIDMDGNFSDELIQTLLGARKITRGSLWLGNRKVQIKNYRGAVRQGIGLIPETWNNHLFMNLSLADNLAFLVYPKMSQGFLMINPRLLKFATQNFFQIFKPDEPHFNFKNFAPQELDQIDRLKILLYRWLLRQPQVLIMVKPSLRIDLVARQSLYNLIENLSREGIAILLVATDLSEASAVSDRALVIKNGKIRGDYSYREIQKITLEDLS